MLTFHRKNKKEYQELEKSYFKKGKVEKENTLNECRKNSFKFDWNEYVPKKPKFLGIKVFKEISIKIFLITLIGNLFSILGVTRKFS